MSLKLSLADAADVPDGRHVQGFVCFSWQSAFQGYCESCYLTKIQVMLEGYVVNKANNVLSSRKKFYSSEILSIRGMYGEKTLGRVLPKRSLTYPFLLNAGRNLVPSCSSSELGLTVHYRLKTRLVLNDPHQRSRDVNSCTYTHVLPYDVSTEAPNNATLDAIQRLQAVPHRLITCPVGDAAGVALLKASLSEQVVGASSLVDVSLSFTNHRNVGRLSRITGKLIQVFTIEKGLTIKKKLELFSIRIDKSESSKDRLELTVPFVLPASLLPTMIEKDDFHRVSYHIQVCASTGKKESYVKLPLIVVR